MLRLNTMLMLLVSISPWFAPGNCLSDVIYTNDGKVVFGIVESENENHIFFQQRLGADGNYLQRVFPRSEIRRLLVTVDRERLTRLKPGDWNVYRDWAEELSIQSVDPEARDLALRLYLIVAYHADEPLRTAGFRGAIQVSGNATPSAASQQRLIRTLAVQVYPGDDSWTMIDASSGKPTALVAAEVRDRLREVAAELRRYRQGMPNTLDRLIEDDLTREAIGLMPSVCTWPRFQDLASRTELDYSAISRLLNLELAILSLVDGEPPALLQRDSPWSVLVHQGRPSVELVSFANVSSFDLEATVFREGAWKKPQ